jgi:hypothetical protein
MSALPTRDFLAVPVLEAGVRIRGRGSPPGGDLFSSADLHAMADAAAELKDELRAPQGPQLVGDWEEALTAPALQMS